MLFYIVCCAKMSTSGHLMFKNVYYFITKQDIEVGSWYGYHLSQSVRSQWNAD